MNARGGKLGKGAVNFKSRTPSRPDGDWHFTIPVEASFDSMVPFGIEAKAYFLTMTDQSTSLLTSTTWAWRTQPSGARHVTTFASVVMLLFSTWLPRTRRYNTLPPWTFHAGSWELLLNVLPIKIFLLLYLRLCRMNQTPKKPTIRWSLLKVLVPPFWILCCVFKGKTKVKMGNRYSPLVPSFYFNDRHVSCSYRLTL